MCFTAAACLEEMITHFPRIASDPLPFSCAHIISESSKRTCKWLEQFQQPKREVKTASLLVLGSSWLMRISSTGKGSCSLWPQKLADFTHQGLTMNSEQNKQEVGFRIPYACTLLAYWTAWLPAFFLFTFPHQYIPIQKQELSSAARSVDQILRKQLSLQPLRGIAWVNTGELVPVDITPHKNWCKQGLEVNLLPLMDLHLHIPLCLTYQRKFSLCSNYVARQAVRFSELPKTRPAHKRSLLTSTGPCTRLHLSHLDFVLMSTKPLAVTQMELTECSPYF